MNFMFRFIGSIIIVISSIFVFGQSEPDECGYVTPKRANSWYFYKNIGLVFSFQQMAKRLYK